MILRAFVMASKLDGAVRASAAMASPMMINSRSTEDRTSREIKTGYSELDGFGGIDDVRQVGALITRHRAAVLGALYRGRGRGS